MSAHAYQCKHKWKKRKKILCWIQQVSHSRGLVFIKRLQSEKTPTDKVGRDKRLFFFFYQKLLFSVRELQGRPVLKPQQSVAIAS